MGRLTAKQALRRFSPEINVFFANATLGPSSPLTPESYEIMAQKIAFGIPYPQAYRDAFKIRGIHLATIEQHAASVLKNTTFDQRLRFLINALNPGATHSKLVPAQERTQMPSQAREAPIPEAQAKDSTHTPPPQPAPYSDFLDAHDLQPEEVLAKLANTVRVSDNPTELIRAWAEYQKTKAELRKAEDDKKYHDPAFLAHALTNFAAQPFDSDKQNNLNCLIKTIIRLYACQPEAIAQAAMNIASKPKNTPKSVTSDVSSDVFRLNPTQAETEAETEAEIKTVNR